MEPDQELFPALLQDSVSQLPRLLDRVDSSRCVLVKESEPFDELFDIWSTPRAGPKVGKWLCQTVVNRLEKGLDCVRRGNMAVPCFILLQVPRASASWVLPSIIFPEKTAQLKL